MHFAAVSETLHKMILPKSAHKVWYRPYNQLTAYCIRALEYHLSHIFVFLVITHRPASRVE